MKQASDLFVECLEKEVVEYIFGLPGEESLALLESVQRAQERSDVIISIGHDVTEKPLFRMGYGGRKVIHVNFYPALIDESIFRPSRSEVIGDIASSVRALCSSCRKVISEFRNHTLEKANDPSFPLKPERFVADLRSTVPEDGILALDMGMYKIWRARNYPAYEHNTVLLDNALASMGEGFRLPLPQTSSGPAKRPYAYAAISGS